MIEKDKVVKVDYIVRDDAGQVIDTTEGAEPLIYLHGAGQIISGLEAVLAGKQVGEAFLTKIEPKDAYGFRNDDLVQTVDITVFEGVEDLQAGMVFNAQSDHGEIQVTVLDIQGNEVIVDGNHPLAGMPLNFEGVIIDVRDATPEEIELAQIH